MKKNKILFLLFIVGLCFTLVGCFSEIIPQVKNVSLNWVPNDEYTVNQVVDISNIEITATLDNNTTQTLKVTSSDVELFGDVSNYRLNTSTHGEKYIGIIYKGLTVKAFYQVFDTVVNGTSIQTAITGAENNAWIKVKAGIYNEALIINKGLTLIADPGVTLNPNNAAFGISFTDPVVSSPVPVVTIKGFTIDGTWTTGGIGQGRASSIYEVHIISNFIKAPAMATAHGNSIQVSGNNSSVIDNTVYCTILNSEKWSSSGILVVKASNVLVENNRIIRAVGSGGNSIGIGVSSWDSDMNNNVVKGNTFYGGIYGISIEQNADNKNHYAYNTSVINNTFSNVQYSISNYFVNPTDNSVENIVGQYSGNNFINTYYEEAEALYFSPISKFGIDLDFLNAILSTNTFSNVVSAHVETEDDYAYIKMTLPA